MPARLFLPAKMEWRGLYRILTTVVAPRPIAFVSSLSREGVPNLSPFSFFNAGGANPPSLVFSVLHDREGKPKDTLRNIRETRGYVVNVVTRMMADGMNVASAAWPSDADEFEKAGFTKAASELVLAPRVLESPIAFECRLHVIVPHGDGPLSAHYVIGEVLAIHAHEEALGPDGFPAPERLDLIGRMGGDAYVHPGAQGLFDLARPKNP